MNRETIAAQLSGQTMLRLTEEQKASCKENGLLVLSGSSDDLVELDGAESDEYGCFSDEFTIFLVRNKLNEKMAHFSVSEEGDPVETENPIKCIYDGSWRFETKIPHATFDILEAQASEEIFCIGIVINIADLK